MASKNPSPVRHAIARSTGATTLAQKAEDGWTVQCLNHRATVTVPNRGKAWTTGSHPQDFCPKCKAIAAGKADKITGGRLDIPKKAAPKKAPARKTTPTTKRVASKTAKVT
ncbi:MAG TPA: hypothetical protein VFD59_07950 [Nocardioidaceae bacterium]|nr:hypothetical protein [Nocardioidaceae bacterium]